MSCLPAQASSALSRVASSLSLPRLCGPGRQHHQLSFFFFFCLSSFHPQSSFLTQPWFLHLSPLFSSLGYWNMSGVLGVWYVRFTRQLKETGYWPRQTGLFISNSQGLIHQKRGLPKKGRDTWSLYGRFGTWDVNTASGSQMLSLQFLLELFVQTRLFYV